MVFDLVLGGGAWSACSGAVTSFRVPIMHEVHYSLSYISVFKERQEGSRLSEASDL